MIVGPGVILRFLSHAQQLSDGFWITSLRRADIPKYEAPILVCYSNPASVERKGASLPRRILDADDAGCFAACMFYHIEPVVLTVFPGEIELSAR